MRRPARTAPAVTALLLALTLGVGACSGSSDGTDGSAPADRSAATGTTRPALATEVRLGKVTGTLSKKGRRHLAHAVGTVVDGWLDAAYVEGDYPRANFRDAYPGFTGGARADARHDRALMSNQGIGRRIDGVTALKRTLSLDALVVHRRPVGVTAHVVLRFRTSGDLARKVEVRGRLFLTHGPHGWRVFGYDVSKGAAR